MAEESKSNGDCCTMLYDRVVFELLFVFVDMVFNGTVHHSQSWDQQYFFLAFRALYEAFLAGVLVWFFNYFVINFLQSIFVKG